MKNAEKNRKVLDYDSPWWGIVGYEDEIPAARYSLFLYPDNDLRGCQMTMEDFFQHNNVFVNGLRGTPAHSDSYMTVVDYQALEAALKLLEEHFQPTASEWQPLLEAWLHNPNTSKALCLAALEIARRYQLDVKRITPEKAREAGWV